MLRPRGTQPSDQGETLVEILVAMAILGTGGVAILAGVMLAVRTSDQHSKAATGGSYVRSWGERIQTSMDAGTHLPLCTASESTYIAIANAMIAEDPNDALTTGFSPSLAVDAVQTSKIMSWNGTAWGACVNGLAQRLLLKFATPGDATHSHVETLSVVVRSPCNGPASSVGQDPCS